MSRCTPDCITPKFATKIEHCKLCHRSFTSTSAGDKHRIGRFGIDRRCRTPEEMLAVGMALNHRGVWMGSTGLDRDFSVRKP